MRIPHGWADQSFAADHPDHAGPAGERWTAAEMVHAWADEGVGRVVCAANVHMVMEAWDDPAFASDLDDGRPDVLRRPAPASVLPAGGGPPREACARARRDAHGVRDSRSPPSADRPVRRATGVLAAVERRLRPGTRTSTSSTSTRPPSGPSRRRRTRHRSRPSRRPASASCSSRSAVPTGALDALAS